MVQAVLDAAIEGAAAAAISNAQLSYSDELEHGDTAVERAHRLLAVARAAVARTEQAVQTVEALAHGKLQPSML